jgi:S1-C subfamily serine protease
MNGQVLLPLLCMVFPCWAAPDWNTLNRAIVRIVAEKGSDTGSNRDFGAGVVISASPDSVRIVTAAHVVAGASGWKVYFSSDRNREYTATLLTNGSGPLDLAVLEVLPRDRPLPTNIPPMDTGAATADQRIWTVDNDWFHISNTVVRLDHDTDTRKFEYTNLAVDDGFSGGPVFDDDGRLVGIHDGSEGGGRYAVAAKIGAVIETLTSPSLGYAVPNLRGGDNTGKGAEPTPAKPNPPTPRVW